MTSRIQLQAEREFDRSILNERKRIQSFPAVLGDGNGNIEHATRDGFVYARLYGDNRQIIHVRDALSVQQIEGMPILVTKVVTEGKWFYKYVGRNDGLTYKLDPIEGSVGSHADQHLRGDLGTGGFDAVDIYNRALIELRAQKQSTANMTVYVNGGEYVLGASYKSFAGGNSGTFTVPAGWRCDLVFLDSANTVQILRGVDAVMSPATKPTPPANCLPLAWVWLTSATTSITETNIEDARPMFGAMLPATLDNALVWEGDVLTYESNILYAV